MNRPPLAVLNVRSSSEAYGPEQALLLLVDALRDYAVDTRILALYRAPEGGAELHPWLERARERGLEAEQLEDGGPFSLDLARRVARRVQGRGADVLHTHDYKSNILGGLAARRPDRSVPWVATVHLHTGTSRRLRLYRAIDLFLLRLADRVVTVSRDQSRMLLARGLDERRVVLVPNVIDVARISAEADDPLAVRARLGLAPDAPVISLVGRLSPQKGIDDFLIAAQVVHTFRPQTRFLVAGQGPLRQALEAQARTLGLEEVLRFLGYRADVPSLLAASDLVALPSRQEGLPVVLLEAMALSRPVVASRVGGVPDVVRDGETGLLIPPRSPDKLAERLLALLDNPEQAGRLGDAARRHVSLHCSPNHAARRLASLYHTILAERAG
jgi:glycosyltransferase involved in cell wall biosynthesis